MLSIDQERALLREFTEVVVADVAPDELLLLPSTTEEFFEDPDKMIRVRSRDEPVGFGLDLELVSPYVLAVAGPVLTYLLSVAAETVKEGSKTLVGEWIRALFKRKDEAGVTDGASSDPTASTEVVPANQAGDTGRGVAAAALTVEQARRLHDIAYERATLLGLPKDRARLLADAVVGGVQVAG